MAKELKLGWQGQDAVRILDIPVPGPELGGIFDRLGSATDIQGESTRLARKLEKDLKDNYGVLLKPWIEYLLGEQT